MAVAGFVYWQVASGGAAPVDAFGHLLGWTDGNNVSTVMAYDQATGVPVGISSGIGQSSAVQSLIYTWDGFGNLEQRCDANRSLAENVTNDDLSRLTGTIVYTGVSVSGSTCAGGSTTNSLGLGYDAMGNITNRTVNGTVETYTPDPNHPYAVGSVTNVNGGTYTASYDADGNMTSRNGYQIQWTPSNLPSSIASANGSSTFSYNPEHARYYQAATFNGVTTDTTYVGGLFEVVSTSTGTTEYRHNIVAGGEVIAVHTIDGNGSAHTSYLHYDHLGSLDAITGDSGSVIQSMSFDAFGLRRDAANWDYDLSQNTIATLKNYTDRGYTDQEQLDNLTLVDLNGRVYDPTVGRMISADPTVPAPLYSQAFNRYTYGYDNPLLYIDPSGFDPNYALEIAGLINSGVGIAGIALSGAGLAWGVYSGNVPLMGYSVGLGAASAYMTTIGFTQMYQGIEGYQQYQAPAFMENIATTLGIAFDPANTIGADLVTKVLLAEQKKINADIAALENMAKHLLNPPKPAPSPPPAAPPPNNGGGGGGNSNRTGSYSYIPVCKTIVYDYYSGPPGSPGTYYQFTTSTTVCF